MSRIVTKYKEYSQNTPGRVLKITSVINCVTYILLKLSYCAKIGNLVISPFTSHDNIYVITPVK